MSPLMISGEHAVWAARLATLPRAPVASPRLSEQAQRLAEACKAMGRAGITLAQVKADH